MDKRPVKLVVADLDGTLLDPSKLPREDIRQAIRALRERGVFFSIATGRTFPSAALYAKEFGIEEPVIAGSGAVVKSDCTGLVLRNLTLPRETAARILRMTRPLEVVTYVFTGDHILVDRPSHFNIRYSRGLGRSIELCRNIMEADIGEPTMIVLRTEDERAERIREDLKDELGDEVSVISSMPFFVDFLHPLASKARGVEILAGHLGIHRDQVMAIGDNYNDIDMVEYAGLGVLVSNAPAELWPRADFVTEAPYAEGVLEALARFI